MKTTAFYRNLFCRADWNIQTILEADEVISQIAKDYLSEMSLADAKALAAEDVVRYLNEKYLINW